MHRRNRPPKRTVTPDPVYNSEAFAKFVNIVMHDGKRAVAERVMYDAVCSQCGAATQVPFSPRPDKPVYCQDCYRTVSGRRTRA